MIKIVKLRADDLMFIQFSLTKTHPSYSSSGYKCVADTGSGAFRPQDPGRNKIPDEHPESHLTNFEFEILKIFDADPVSCQPLDPGRK
jgi:hypothetical protein